MLGLFPKSVFFWVPNSGFILKGSPFSSARPGTQCMLNHTRHQSGCYSKRGRYCSKSGIHSYSFTQIRIINLWNYSLNKKNVLLILADHVINIFDYNLSKFYNNVWFTCTFLLFNLWLLLLEKNLYIDNHC